MLKKVQVHKVGKFIYFTSDKRIQSEDYVRHTNNDIGQVINTYSGKYDMKLLCGAITEGLSIVNAKKIVATTDPKLHSQCSICYSLDKCHKHKQHCNNWDKHISRIPSDFIKKYVEEQGNIKEVELEIDDYYEHEYGGKIRGTYNSNKFPLKINSDGVVIIHDIMEKMYTREELRNAIEDALEEKVTPYSYLDIYGFEKWFDKNYPKTN